MNTLSTMRLFYTRDVIGKADEIVALEIIEELNDFRSAWSRKPIIFIGYRQPLIDGSCVLDGGYVTATVYAMDYSAEPRYFWSTGRILNYFKTLGFAQFCGPAKDEELMLRAREDAQGMPIWPLSGSILEFDEYIIVKLNNDYGE